MAKRGPKPILSEDEINWAYEKWCEGYTRKQIADALYVCCNTLDAALKGKPKKKNGVRPKLVYPGNEVAT